MRRLGRWVLYFVSGLTLLGVGTASAAFVWPRLLLNPTSLALMRAVAANFGVTLSWTESTTEASSHEVWEKRAHIALTDLCVRSAKRTIDACFDKFDVAFALWVKPGEIAWREIGPVKIGGPGTHLILALPKSGKTNDEPFDLTQIKRPRWLKGTVMKGTDLEIAAFSVKSAALAGKGSFKASLRADDRGGARLNMALKDLCVSESPLPVKGCLNFSAMTKFTVENDIFVLGELGPLALSSQVLKINLQEPAKASLDQSGRTLPKAPEGKDKNDLAKEDSGQKPAPLPVGVLFRLPTWLQSTQLKPWSVKVDHFELASEAKSAKPWSIQSKFHGSLTPQEQALHVASDFGRLCLRGADATWSGDGCFASAKIELGLSRSDQGDVQLRAIGPVTFVGGKMDLLQKTRPKPIVTPKAPKANGKGSFNPAEPVVPGWLTKSALKPISVTVNDARVETDGKKIASKFAIKGGQSAAGVWHIDASIADAGGDKPLPVKHGKWQAQISSQKGAFTGPWTIASDAEMTLIDGKKVVATLKVRQEGDDTLDFLAKGQAPILKMQLAGKINRQGINAELAGKTLAPIPGLANVETSGCQLALDWREAHVRPAVFKSDCAVVLTPKGLALQDELPLWFPPSFTVKSQGSLTSRFPPSMSEPLKGEFDLSLVPVITPELRAAAKTRLNLAGSLGELPESLDVHVDGGAQVEIPEFEALAATLRASEFAIPAPFDVLKGNVQLKVAAQGNATRGALTFPITFTSRLASAKQVVTLDARGEGTLSAGTKLPTITADLVMSDVQLALPTIPLKTQTPHLIPDKRIRPVKAVSAAPRLAYHLHIHSPEAKPARLLTNLAKEPVPIAIDTTLNSGEPPTGGLTVGKVPINFFRRNARVEHFSLRLAEPDPELDGKLQVIYTDYTINILALGTTKNPIIRIESEPPRPERELIAILLFGRDMQELEDDQMKSADSMRAAAADGALSLASLYLLASTPVESIGYDPQAKAFTAKVALGQGTSLNLGSDFEDYKKLGLRRRLNRTWSIETFVERRAEENERSATALLEWSKHY